ncbi:glutamate 5-kinase [Thalassotalea profundi]|uniref:Glutamate 5-kinase n=1 Tax=Thalassotalea profundi TaxID=2036687 RepID=A0ABQ3IAA8_9GAMM|nr:glutamate 5-kinase [Thalassotalea profundi]GHE76736.1 glutamate 5-kinase [Thalassotalea profundi]
MNLKTHKRIVIKIGSALIAPGNKGCSTKYLRNIAYFIQRCRQQGQQVILVSSGSVAAGRQWFNSEKSPSKAMKKAMAATGQNDMMATWSKLLDMPLAQILLTHADLCNRERYVSIKETIEELLAHDVLPVINENDTVTSEELKVGDNDNLAAMAAASIDADMLIMCTDVDGLFDKNPHSHADAKLLEKVSDITPAIYAMAGGAVSSMGTGGMQTKIEAAEKSTAHGIDTLIINGFKVESFNQLLAGNNPGTHFLSNPEPMSPAVHWRTHTVRERGEVIIDDEEYAFTGDEEILTSDNILEVKGEFSVGDTILVTTEDGTKIAKAKTNFSSCLLNYIAQEQDDKWSNKQVLPQNNSIISKENIAVLGDA